MYSYSAESVFCDLLTGEQVSYIFDEVAELLVALLHPLFAAVGFDQHLHSVRLGLVSAVVGLPHLTTNKITDVLTSTLSYATLRWSLTILESLSTSCIADRISWSRSLADLRAVWEVGTRPLQPSPPH